MIMAVEIERKFLVTGRVWKEGVKGVVYRQGYLNTDTERTVRVRIAGEQGFLTVKGKTEGISRLEFEYSIPVDEAGQMLDRLCLATVIEKYRYRVSYRGKVWEIDEFLGANQGLVLAEIELESEEELFDPPPWLGREVSGESRFYNSSLSRNPYGTWSEEEKLLCR
jgi:CYTH domain-containing protein